MNPVSHALLQGASNFRDVGGYRNTEGRRVRPGQVFRSDHLALLTPQDHARLQALGVQHSLDFRGQAEYTTTPYNIPGVQRVALSIEPTVIARMQSLVAQGIVPTTEETVELMRETYRDFVNHNAHTFGQFFKASARTTHPSGVSLHRRQRPHRLCCGAAVVCIGSRPRHHRTRLFADQPTLQTGPSAGRNWAPACHAGALASTTRIFARRV